MAFTLEARLRALRAMCGGTLQLGLATSVIDGALREVSDRGYTRVALSLAEDGASMVNETEDIFPPWGQDADGQVRHWFIVGVDGTLIATDELPQRDERGWFRPLAGETIRFLPGDIRLDMEGG